MKLIKQAIALGLVSLAAAFAGCSDEPQKIQPQAQGQRGETCQARNDCAGGLACVSGRCVKSEFQIAAEVKQCDIIHCATTDDCCGSRPTEAPAKCANRASICATPTLPGCTSGVACTSNDTCGGGTCGTGFCASDGLSCTSDEQCSDYCTSTGIGFVCAANPETDCVDSDDCTGAVSCTNRTCACTNPDYDPFDPICSDPDCVDVCTLTCDNERCVQDDSCSDDTECSFLTPHCAGGRCVECVQSTDCDEDDGESCVENVCKKPCEANEECPLFHQCQQGSCVETGCSSDRECVLAFFGQAFGAEDSRLARCLPSDTEPGIGTCKIPCENDATCGQLQVCDSGFCKFVGCENDEQCRAYYGLQNQTTSDIKPYLDKAVCRE